MLRLSRFLSLVATLLGALAATWPARAHAEGLHLAEYVGLEAGPGWMNLASEPPFGSLPFLSWAPTGTLRLVRLETMSWYWTPIQAGLGVAPSYDFLVHASTEIGRRFVLDGSGFLDVGVAAGVGGSMVEFAEARCDGGCWAGGYGPLLSPVVRVGWASRAFSAALFARFLLVVDTTSGADHEAHPLLFGVDVALRRSPN